MSPMRLFWKDGRERDRESTQLKYPIKSDSFQSQTFIISMPW